MEHAKQLNSHLWTDQEAFVISIHSTCLKLTAAWFSKEYLSHVNSPTMPTTEILWIRRSKAFDLKLQADRAQALKLYIGLVGYLPSGQAEVGLIQKLFE
jgi:hypothetical protein